MSLYAATKKANELMAHTYSHLFRLPTTGLRFFTVYGPWGRPDMALFLFTRAILAGRPIDVFNQGQMRRDFTYIDDIVEGLLRVLDRTAQPDLQWSSQRPDPGTSNAPYRVYNIGNHEPVELLEMIALVEQCLGRKAEEAVPADAARRRARDLCRRGRSRPRHGFLPAHALAGRDCPVHRVVSGVLSVERTLEQLVHFREYIADKPGTAGMALHAKAQCRGLDGCMDCMQRRMSDGQQRNERSRRPGCHGLRIAGARRGPGLLSDGDV